MDVDDWGTVVQQGFRGHGPVPHHRHDGLPPGLAGVDLGEAQVPFQLGEAVPHGGGDGGRATGDVELGGRQRQRVDAVPGGLGGVGIGERGEEGELRCRRPERHRRQADVVAAPRLPARGGDPQRGLHGDHVALRGRDRRPGPEQVGPGGGVEDDGPPGRQRQRRRLALQHQGKGAAVEWPVLGDVAGDDGHVEGGVEGRPQGGQDRAVAGRQPDVGVEAGVGLADHEPGRRRARFGPGHGQPAEGGRPPAEPVEEHGVVDRHRPGHAPHGRQSQGAPGHQPPPDGRRPGYQHDPPPRPKTWQLRQNQASKGFVGW